MSQRYAARVDATQAAIVKALRDCGVSVWIIGLPVDLLCGYQGRTFLLECKSLTGKRKPRAAKYTDLQKSFMATWWGAPVVTVTDAEGAVASLRQTEPA